MTKCVCCPFKFQAKHICLISCIVFVLGYVGEVLDMLQDKERGTINGIKTEREKTPFQWPRANTLDSDLLFFVSKPVIYQSCHIPSSDIVNQRVK